MNFELSLDQSRRLALGLFVAVVFVIGGIIYLPVSWLHQHYDEPLMQMYQSLSRSQQLILSQEELDTALTELWNKKPDRYFLASHVPSLGASEIQEIAKRKVEETGADLSSMQIEHYTEENGFRKFTVKVSMICHIKQLASLLYQLELGQPYLFIDMLSIVSRNSSRQTGSDIIDPDLFVSFDLSGYARVESGK